MGAFLFGVAKNLLSYWASKLISPEAITELVITLAEAHSKRTDTDTDDKLVIWLKKNISKPTDK